MQQWNDEHLRWNKYDFGGIDQILFPIDNLWIPDIVINELSVVLLSLLFIASTCCSMEQKMMPDNRYASVHSNGDVLIQWMELMTVYCR